MVLTGARLATVRRGSLPARRWEPAAAAIGRRLDQLGATAPSSDRAASSSSWSAPGAGLVASVHRRCSAGRHAAVYERELPVLLEAVAARLRAGASVAQAVVATAPAVSRSGFDGHWRRVVDDTPTIGVEAALARWAEAADAVPSVRLAAGALTLAVATGGSAARAVDGVASTLRARLALSEEVRALSAQARSSATVIALAPVGFGVIAGLGDRRIVEFFASPLGAVLLVIGLGLDAAGAWWMHRLCRVAP